MTNEDQVKHLQGLWQQGARQVAIDFFRRALSLNLTLQEVLGAIQFTPVHEHVATITLGDVLSDSHATKPSPGASKVDRPRGGHAARKKRKRRNPRQLQQLRDLVLKHLAAGDGSAPTTAILAKLQHAGVNLALSKAHSMLKALESAGLVESDSGRPKLWRLKMQGRRVPDPVIIKRGTATPQHNPKMADGAATGGRPAAREGALLSQTEVQAAAEALRARFFASKMPS